MASSVKVGGAWQALDKIHARVAGVWQPVKKAYVRVGGVWQTVYSALSVVVAATKSITDFRLQPTNSYAYVKVDSDGSLYQYTGTTAPGTYTSYETWLDAGSNTEVWVERTIISGSLYADAGSGRLACTSDRVFGVREIGFGVSQCVLDLKFYDAASGGNLLDTQRVTLTAEVDNFA